MTIKKSMILYYINQTTESIMENQITAQQAAELLNCSISFIRKAKQQGKLAFTSLGGRYTFERQDVLKLRKKTEPHNNDIILE